MRVWPFLLMLCTLGLLPLGAVARPTMPLSGAEEAIVRADALGATQSFDAAIGVLQRAIGRYPTYQRLYLSLAYWQEVRGVFGPAFAGTLDERKAELRRRLAAYPALGHELFDTYGLAMMYAQDAREVQRRVADLTYYDYPVSLGQYGPLALPGDPVPFTYTLTDPQLPAERRGVQQCIVTGTPLPLAMEVGADGRVVDARYTRDPKYGGPNSDARYSNWKFNQALLGYDYDPSARRWSLRFRVMWYDATGRNRERQELARNTLHLLLRLSGLARAYGGYTPRFSKDGVVNVWLAERGEAGGEAVNENLYLMEVGVKRSGAEWLREVAHEYGHATLPVVGGYTKPEWGANGRLGERLYLHWLLRNTDAQDPHPWVRGLDPAGTKAARVDALVRQFATLGPDSLKLQDNDSVAMDAFVGMALYLEQARGSAALSTVLNGLGSPVIGDFLRGAVAYEATAQSGAQPVVLLRVADLPKDAPYWVYLTDGQWRLALESSDDPALKVRFEMDGKPVRPDPLTGITLAKIDKPGWHQLKLAPEGVVMPKVTAVRLVKQ